MRKGMIGFFVMLCCGAFLAGGCAKKEMVKGEETMPSATRPGEQPPGAEGKEGGMKTETIKEAPVAVKEEPMTSGAAQDKSLQRINFDYDSYLLTQPARDTLAADADMLMKKIPGKVIIEGHCDERGSDEYNLALGEKRAKSAMNYLVTLGVPADRLSIISYGKEKPLDPGHDEAAWAKNRRAEFVITK